MRSSITDVRFDLMGSAPRSMPRTWFEKYTIPSNIGCTVLSIALESFYRASTAKEIPRIKNIRRTVISC